MSIKKLTEAKLNAMLSGLWQKNLPTLRERLALLDQAARIAATGCLPEAARLEALSIAHKLSGSLGMFGHQQSTELARDMEKVLRSSTPEELTTLPALATQLRDSLSSSL
jgi:HPt (histidine-containing phosphotransfer) domain-containing protein